jgi:sporulation protein YlmC with PRC-barrel domain
MFTFSSALAAEHQSKNQTAEKAHTEMGEQAAETQEGAETMMQEGEEYTHGMAKAADMRGMPVMDSKGEKIGKIGDMLVDTQTGRITYVMLESGGVFGVGGETYPVPWQAVHTGPEKQGLQVNFSAEEMKNAPKGGQITSMDQARTIHEFYGVSPHWEQQEGMESMPEEAESRQQPAEGQEETQ